MKLLLVAPGHWRTTWGVPLTVCVKGEPDYPNKEVESKLEFNELVDVVVQLGADPVSKRTWARLGFTSLLYLYSSSNGPWATIACTVTPG